MTPSEFKTLTIVGVLPPITRPGRGGVRPGRVKSTPSPSITSKPSTGLLRAILRFVGSKRG
jgi:hypothetical protein